MLCIPAHSQHLRHMSMATVWQNAKGVQGTRCLTVVMPTGGASGSKLNSNLLMSMAKATTASKVANWSPVKHLQTLSQTTIEASKCLPPTAQLLCWPSLCPACCKLAPYMQALGLFLIVCHLCRPVHALPWPLPLPTEHIAMVLSKYT